MTASEMGFKCIVLFLAVLFVLTNATSVTMNSTWKQNIGWEVTCVWKLYSNDSLQSVRLYSNDRQFMIYRPEVNGPSQSQIFRVPHTMQVDCGETSTKGVTGLCVLTLELFQPPTQDFTYACEVSGERPMFRLDKKDILITAFVPPNDAVIKATAVDKDQSSHVMLNCSSSGLPAPNLVWTIGDQKMPSDFTGSSWNVTSKLWQVWSQLSYTSSNENLSVVCTPEGSHNGQTMKGKSAVYNSSSRTDGSMSILAVLVIATLLR